MRHKNTIIISIKNLPASLPLKFDAFPKVLTFINIQVGCNLLEMVVSERTLKLNVYCTTIYWVNIFERAALSIKAKTIIICSP